jgi:hypothetical protein
MDHKTFRGQLENLRSEAHLAARYVYAELAIDYSASKSKRLLQKLNETPYFWMLCKSGFQAGAYLALSRAFEDRGKSRFNLDNLLAAFERDLVEFQREALRARKLDNRTDEPEWLEQYLADAYYPTTRDISYLQRAVEKQRVVFKRAVLEPRNKYFAHKQVADRENVRELFGKGTVRDICTLSLFLVRLHEVLLQLYDNGRKPRLGRFTYSIRAILRDTMRKPSANSFFSPHKTLVREVSNLMATIELVPFNLDLKKELTLLRRRRTALRGSITTGGKSKTKR